MAEFVVLPARNAVKMPNDMPFEIGAFVEPMSCVVHAMNRLQLQAGNSVLLFGAEWDEQLVQAVSRLGASKVIVVDVSANKLELAKSLGAKNAAK
jgi:threonine dehydrogenase-like Zn-dependent dehydrogenase